MIIAVNNLCATQSYKARVLIINRFSFQHHSEADSLPIFSPFNLLFSKPVYKKRERNKNNKIDLYFHSQNKFSEVQITLENGYI